MYADSPTTTIAASDLSANSLASSIFSGFLTPEPLVYKTLVFGETLLLIPSRIVMAGGNGGRVLLHPPSWFSTSSALGPATRMVSISLGKGSKLPLFLSNVIDLRAAERATSLCSLQPASLKAFSGSMNGFSKSPNRNLTSKIRRTDSSIFFSDILPFSTRLNNVDACLEPEKIAMSMPASTPWHTASS